MDHISDDWLERYSMRTLHESHMPWVEEHLLVCRECQARLKATDEYISATKAAAALIEKEESSNRHKH
ncbi:MAG: hypothetical protein J0H49_10565 [Acidobacteria bacterium]|nr:hypothetical protein [Acidobacteriota bacterium]